NAFRRGTHSGAGRVSYVNPGPPTRPLFTPPQTAPDCSISPVAFSPDGKTLAGVSFHSTPPGTATVRLWDVATGRPIGKALHTGAVGLEAFSPGGKTLASVSYRGTDRVGAEAARGPTGQAM